MRKVLIAASVAAMALGLSACKEVKEDTEVVVQPTATATTEPCPQGLMTTEETTEKAEDCK